MILYSTSNLSPSPHHKSQLTKPSLLEAARLTTTTRLIRHTTSPTTISNTTYPAKSTIILDLSLASQDPKTYPSPDKIDPTRPLSSYLLFRNRSYESLSYVALTAMFKTILIECPNIGKPSSTLSKYTGRGGGWRPWGQGDLKSVVVSQGTGVVEGGLGKCYMTEDWRAFRGSPSTGKVVFDA